jgi:hypothetical protein
VVLEGSGSLGCIGWVSEWSIEWMDGLTEIGWLDGSIDYIGLD